LLAACPAASSGKEDRAAPESGLVSATSVHGGRERTFHVHVPPGHSPARPVPLVIALHGGGGSGERLDEMADGQFTRGADARGWVVVFPDGVENGWNDGRPLSSARDRRRAGVDDVAFIAALIDHAHSRWGIDRARVYATGISNGGFMSVRLGIDLSDRLAAVAPVTASVSLAVAASAPKRPIPVLFVNGTDDPLVPYAGGAVKVLGRERGEILSTDDAVAWWVRHNRCRSAPVSRALPDLAPDDGTRVTVTTWGGGDQGAEVVLYRIDGGGHTWPGGRPYLGERMVGRVCRDFEGVEAIFDFFARHRLPARGTAR
jgi:polyhydroxybutyrate depolymerase